ncbi:hypothetical protein Pmani_023637 [Petrolisthes manimaculis]|uniref:Phenylalanine--tRNA ligase, mitochondrial n=1 Tax=Petrolisthes manimaculis TaxID=1843537 RepID=A0AAE1PAQ2_9EUCA|nr:hypothetical protein Pmani_023637 [Petrolisthes manimaculis]
MVVVTRNFHLAKLIPSLSHTSRHFSVKSTYHPGDQVTVGGRQYPSDHMTNITPHILSHMGRNLHLQQYHPLCHISDRIVKYMYGRYLTPRGSPLFSVHSQLHPVVTTQQNFDSLLIPKDHVSRKKSDNFYVNKEQLLRAHTSAHQCELMRMGLDNFLVIGDVYRRDEIDSSHYPVFHQVEGVRLLTKSDVYGKQQDMKEYELFTPEGPPTHHPHVINILKADLKDCLQGLATTLFGRDVEMRWVDAYFPFTHPSWELEVKLNDQWIEMLGCGIIQHQVLLNADVEERVGWAFGLGLERWAMKLYQIPDIRVFWSTDPGFLSQFVFDDPATNVNFKVVSKHTPCINDISFWLPSDSSYEAADFYDIVRSIGGNLVEQVYLVDQFTHPHTGRTSHCYRIVYRHMDRILTQEEVNRVHSRIEQETTTALGVTVR